MSVTTVPAAAVTLIAPIMIARPLNLPIDPLFIAILGSVFCMAAGYYIKKLSAEKEKNTT